MKPLNVTVWNEFVHERRDDAVRQIYPDGIHAVLAAALRQSPGLEVRTATLDEPEQGLPVKVLDATDVLVWWGHVAHDRVKDSLVDRIQKRVLAGMGLVVLHSGHHSKIFKRLMGTGCDLLWREAGERERVWVVNPSHPIAAGVDECIEIEHSEMYGEPFTIPTPDELIFISWYEGGEVFRGGCTWQRGAGRVFYFSPGHETHPIYHQPEIQRVIANGVHWARPQGPAPNVPRNVPTAPTRARVMAFGPSAPQDIGSQP